MAKRNRFLLKSSRRTTETLAYCFASPELFVPLVHMSEAARDEFEKNGPIPCEGSGLPGQWCDSCRFGRVDAPDDV